MYDTIFHNLGVRLHVDALSDAMFELGYAKDAESTEKVYLFRNKQYHLKIVPKKTRLEIHLHKYITYLTGHKAIKTGKDIKKEFKQIKRVLEDILK